MIDKFNKSLYIRSVWLFVGLFIVFYPMLISIYVFLPLFIGVMGYILIQGIEKGNVYYILISIIYFINLEVNLSLPFFFTFISILLVYVLFYHSLRYINKCVMCGPVLSVFLIDTVYLGSLLTYDFIMQTNSIMLDNILLYSLVVDILMVVML